MRSRHSGQRLFGAQTVEIALILSGHRKDHRRNLRLERVLELTVALDGIETIADNAAQPAQSWFCGGRRAPLSNFTAMCWLSGGIGQLSCAAGALTVLISTDRR